MINTGFNTRNRILASPASICLTVPSRFSLSLFSGLMNNRYRLICYGLYGGTYYIHDTFTDSRWNLRTKDKARATKLVVAKNESAREPAFRKLAFTCPPPIPKWRRGPGAKP